MVHWLSKWCRYCKLWLHVATKLKDHHFATLLSATDSVVVKDGWQRRWRFHYNACSGSDDVWFFGHSAKYFEFLFFIVILLRFFVTHLLWNFASAHRWRRHYFTSSPAPTVLLVFGIWCFRNGKNETNNFACVHYLLLSKWRNHNPKFYG